MRFGVYHARPNWTHGTITDSCLTLQQAQRACSSMASNVWQTIVGFANIPTDGASHSAPESTDRQPATPVTSGSTTQALMPFVLDVSIPACWALQDEEDPRARAAFARIRSDEEAVPSLW